MSSEQGITIYKAQCKDCRAEFTYSERQRLEMLAQGQSPPERCPIHRASHSREIRAIAMSHFELKPRKKDATVVIKSGGLGSVIHTRDANHYRASNPPPSDDFDVAITDDDIRELFRELRGDGVQVAVIEGATGSGKSTMLPYKMMCPPAGEPVNQFTKFGPIILTEPTIQAAQRTATTIATKLHGGGLGTGHEVGYRHSQSRAMDKRNKLVVITDGSLISWIGSGMLGEFGTIIIDEAHERSLNIDLIIGLLRQELPRYPHLRVIIASATIDAQHFIDFFQGATKVWHRQFEGKKNFGYGDPVFTDGVSFRDTNQVRAAVIKRIFYVIENREPGDMLVFLPTIKFIDSAIQELRNELTQRKLGDQIMVHPLHSRLTEREQSAALSPDPDGKTKIVLATTLAETSLTVEGLTYVVDSGLVAQPLWDPITEQNNYAPKTHSQAGCRQRWGRVGRDAPGEVFPIYSEDQFKEFAPYTKAEIERSPLDNLILGAKAAGVQNLDEFPWVSQPNTVEISRAQKALKDIGALDEDGDITEHGLELRNMSMDAALASLVINADELACATEMAALVALLLAPRKTGLQVLAEARNWDVATHYAADTAHTALAQGCWDDLDLLLKIFQGWSEAEDRQEWARFFFINHETLIEADRRRAEILAFLSAHKKDDEVRPIDFSLLDRVRVLLLRGLREDVYGQLSQNDPGAHYEQLWSKETTKPRKISLAAGSLLRRHRTQSKYFVTLKLDSAQPGSDLFGEASIVAAIEPSWLEDADSDANDLIQLARTAARLTRTQGREHHASELSASMITCRCRLGDRYLCRIVGGGISGPVVVAAKELLERAIPFNPSTFEGEPLRLPDLGEELSEGLAASVGGEINSMLPVQSEPERPEDEWLGWADDSEPAQGPSVSGPALSFRAVISEEVEVNDLGDKDFEAFVTGFDMDNSEAPVLLMPALENKFQAFCEQHSLGDAVEVEALRYIAFARKNSKYVFGWVVKDCGTGVEIIVDGSELTMAVDSIKSHALKEIRPGDIFSLSLYALVNTETEKRIHLTRIPDLRRHYGDCWGEKNHLGATVRAVLKMNNGTDLQIRINMSGPTGIAHWAVVKPGRATKRAFKKTDVVEVGPRRNEDKDKFEELMLGLPTDLADTPLPDAFLDAANKKLFAYGPLSLESRIALRTLVRDPASGWRVDKLYRKSNRLNLRLHDSGAIDKLAGNARVGDEVTCIILDIFNGRGVVSCAEVPGLLDWIDASEAEPLRIGAEETFRIRRLDPEKQHLVVEPIHDRANHPLMRYTLPATVSAKVTSKNAGDLYLFVEPGVEGKINSTGLKGVSLNKFKIGGWFDFIMTNVDYGRRSAVFALPPGQYDDLPVTFQDILDEMAELTSVSAVDGPQPAEPARPTVADYKKGQRLMVRITNVVRFGAFAVDVKNGLSGLIPTGRLSWDWVDDPADIVAVGQEVEVIVEYVDLQKQQVTLCLRKPEDKPFVKLEPGEMVKGTVAKVFVDRAAVNLANGCEAIIEADQVSWCQVKRIQHFIKEGQIIDAQVLAGNDAGNKYTISLKTVENDPTRWAPGQELTGTVTGIAPFGVFMTLPGFSNGLIGSNQLGPSDHEVRIGDELRVKVLNVNGNPRRVALTRRGLPKVTRF